MGSNNKTFPEINWTIIIIVFTLMASAIVLFYLSGNLDPYQYIQLLLTLSFLLTSVVGLLTAKRQETYSRLQAEVARDSLRASVAPNLFFRIRPANDYWNGPFGRQPASWEPGVGIYIENIGLGPVLNIKLLIKAEGERARTREEISCEAELMRLLPGMIYTLPSKQFPELVVTKNHDRIVIKSLEYNDIRNPPNHFRDVEPAVLDLSEYDFNENTLSSVQPTEVRRRISPRARAPLHTFIVKWNLSGSVMSGPYGKIDIPHSDSESKLIVERHESEGIVKIIGDMRRLKPEARYKLDVCKEYALNSPHFPGRFSDTISKIQLTTDSEGCGKAEFNLQSDDFPSPGVHTISVFLNDSVDGRTILISDNFAVRAFS